MSAELIEMKMRAQMGELFSPTTQGPLCLKNGMHPVDSSTGKCLLCHKTRAQLAREGVRS